MKNILSGLARALALGVPLCALAQAPAPTAADSKASAPALRYRSAFADYKPWQEVKAGDWRQLNDAVAPTEGKNGGHAGHGAAAASAPAAPAARPSAAAAPPQGHRMRKGQP